MLRQKSLSFQFVISILFLLGLALVVSYLVVYSENPESINPRQRPPIVVSTWSLKKAKYTPQAMVMGEVATHTPYAIRSHIRGEVEKVWVKIGQAVKSGQILLTLDTTDLKRKKQTLALDRARLLSQREVEFKRYQSQIQQRQTLYDQKKTAGESVHDQINSEKVRQSGRMQQKTKLAQLVKLSQNDYNRQKELLKQGVVTQSILELSEQKLLQLRLDLDRLDNQIEQSQHVVKQLLYEKERLWSTLDLQINELDTAIVTYQNRRAEKNQQLTKLELQFKKLDDDLRDSKITATEDAVISDVLVADGARIQIGETCIRMSSDQSYYVQADIPIDVYHNIQMAKKVGQPVNAVWHQSGGNSLALTFVRFLPKVQSGVRLAEFKLSDSPDVNKDTWVQGLPLSLRLSLLPVSDTYLIPTSSLYPGSRVVVVDAIDRIRLVSVRKVGYLWDQSGRLLMIIAADENIDNLKVVKDYQPSLMDGMAVSIAPENYTEGSS